MSRLGSCNVLLSKATYLKLYKKMIREHIPKVVVHSIEQISVYDF